MALLITFGVIGQVSVIIAGPSTGLVAVGESGYLPRGLQKTNSRGVNKPILYVQAIFVSLLSLVLVVLPSVESAYQVMSQMATVIYLILVLMIILHLSDCVTLSRRNIAVSVFRVVNSEKS